MQFSLFLNSSLLLFFTSRLILEPRNLLSPLSTFPLRLSSQRAVLLFCSVFVDTHWFHCMRPSLSTNFAVVAASHALFSFLYLHSLTQPSEPAANHHMLLLFAQLFCFARFILEGTPSPLRE